MGLTELLFAFIVVAAVVAVLFKPETGGLIVMTVAMGAAFYQLAVMVGPSLWLAIFAVFVAAAVKIVDEVSGADVFGNVSLAVVLDRVLTRMQGGGPQNLPTGGRQQEQRGQQQRRDDLGPIWDDED